MVGAATADWASFEGKVWVNIDIVERDVSGLDTIAAITRRRTARNAARSGWRDPSRVCITCDPDHSSIDAAAAESPRGIPRLSSTTGTLPPTESDLERGSTETLVEKPVVAPQSHVRRQRAPDHSAPGCPSESYCRGQ